MATERTIHAFPLKTVQMGPVGIEQIGSRPWWRSWKFLTLGNSLILGLDTQEFISMNTQFP